MCGPEYHQRRRSPHSAAILPWVGVPWAGLTSAKLRSTREALQRSRWSFRRDLQDPPVAPPQRIPISSTLDPSTCPHPIFPWVPESGRRRSEGRERGTTALPAWPGPPQICPAHQSLPAPPRTPGPASGPPLRPAASACCSPPRCCHPPVSVPPSSAPAPARLPRPAPPRRGPAPASPASAPRPGSAPVVTAGGEGAGRLADALLSVPFSRTAVPAPHGPGRPECAPPLTARPPARSPSGKVSSPAGYPARGRSLAPPEQLPAGSALHRPAGRCPPRGAEAALPRPPCPRLPGPWPWPWPAPRVPGASWAADLASRLPQRPADCCGPCSGAPGEVRTGRSGFAAGASRARAALHRRWPRLCGETRTVRWRGPVPAPRPRRRCGCPFRSKLRGPGGPTPCPPRRAPPLRMACRFPSSPGARPPEPPRHLQMPLSRALWARLAAVGEPRAPASTPRCLCSGLAGLPQRGL